MEEAPWEKVATFGHWSDRTDPYERLDREDVAEYKADNGSFIDEDDDIDWDDDDDDAVPVKKVKKADCDDDPLSHGDAFRIYIDMMARIHRDPASVVSDKEHAATQHIENVICTVRESMLASGAWNETWVAEIKSRPFFYRGPECVGKHQCSACHRTSEFAYRTVYLSGPVVDGARMWTSRWIDELPKEAFGHTARPKEERQRLWNITLHCLERSALYHALLHYKFHLFIRVRDVLQTHDKITDEFVDAELSRFSQAVDPEYYASSHSHLIFPESYRWAHLSS